jgi:hypothetical protein
VMFSLRRNCPLFDLLGFVGYPYKFGSLIFDELRISAGYGLLALGIALILLGLIRTSIFAGGETTVYLTTPGFIDVTSTMNCEVYGGNSTRPLATFTNPPLSCFGPYVLVTETMTESVETRTQAPPFSQGAGLSILFLGVGFCAVAALRWSRSRIPST